MAHVIYSDDHGKTWDWSKAIGPKMNECQIVELAEPKGTLMLNMRNYLGVNRRAHSLSYDGGLTWSAPEVDPQLDDPVCQASILRCSWPSTKDPGRILFANPASTNRRNLTVRVSYDDGKSWPVSKSLDAGLSAYSCLAILPDKSIGCLYERGFGTPYEKIILSRFSLSWLEASK
jgi:sialidase-1